MRKEFLSPEVLSELDKILKENSDYEFKVLPCSDGSELILAIKPGESIAHTWRVKDNPLSPNGISIVPKESKIY